MREQGTEGGTEGGRAGGRRKVGIWELEGRKVGGESRKDGGREEGGRRGSRRED